MSMNLNDLLRTLGQAANAQPSSSGSANSDPVSAILGGLLGGGTQQSGAAQSTGGADVANLLGSLLAGGASQQQPTGGGGLGGLLSGLFGGGSSNQSSMAANPILDPVVNLVTQKTGLPPAVASMAVSFAMTQVVNSLANKAQGGGSQQGLQYGNLAQHLANGHPVDASTLTSSGLAQQFATQSGLDLPTATQALEHTLGAIAPAMAGGSVPNAPAANNPLPKPTSSKPPKRKS